ncbi:MAG TPA: hypothetical protein VKU88_07295 [Acidimicrobiales bacterium]|nr:hypothetical protein [Acidimicrobiales bacterium]
MGGTDRMPEAALAMARRFAAGATLWCASPEWPWHARHVAVEFVHPVIVGKRALPSVAIGEAPLDETLRAASRPGDLFLAVATSGRADVAGALRMCPVWGLTGIWIGAGPPPPAGTADHVLWSTEAAADAAYDGELVRAYHVLWELTHVCFEHPGLLSAEPSEGCDAEGHCVTCSDEGRLGEVVAVGQGEVTVRSSAGFETVDATLVEAPHEGDLVLVHAGTAISRAEL